MVCLDTETTLYIAKSSACYRTHEGIQEPLGNMARGYHAGGTMLGKPKSLAVRPAKQSPYVKNGSYYLKALSILFDGPTGVPSTRKPK